MPEPMAPNQEAGAESPRPVTLDALVEQFVSAVAYSEPCRSAFRLMSIRCSELMAGFEVITEGKGGILGTLIGLSERIPER